MGNIYAERVSALRRLMMENGWDAVLVSGSDPHGSEYPAPRWKQVEWLSGFTGEAGDIVVTMDHAGLWTDSRYFIQAADELAGSGIELHKTRVPGAVGIPEWVAGKAAVVALDGKCWTASQVKAIVAAMDAAHKESESDYSIADVPDMLDRLWEDRPWIPQTPVTTLDEGDVGESRLHKIVWLRKFLMSEGYGGILLSSLEDIAWVLNVRGQDIEYNPYVISYLLVTLDDVSWYIKKEGSAHNDADTADSFNELRADGISVLGYDEVELGLSAIGSEDPQGKLFVDASSLNYSLYKLIRYSYGEDNVVAGISPVMLRKAIKNPVEISNLRDAFLEDGLAVEKFLYWLEKESVVREIDEKEASDRLTAFRQEIPGYRGNSFANISAYGPSAALPHYSTPEEGSSVIESHGLYLTDSGGQYIFGTTDITRTVPMGECTALEKEDYTLVLKGMIGLASAVFPKGTAGCQIDVLARNPLWGSKRNFGHGTGHGVGFYLGVHEGPQDIRQNFNSQPLLPGMVTSDEPGIYREGMHGVRHENILLCCDAGSNDFGEWLCFETLTCCHIDTSAVVAELMTDGEIEWLNAYNTSVCKRLSPHLPSDIAQWLREKTGPVGRR